MAASPHVPPLLAAFEGRWSLTRVVTDQQGGAQGHLNGVAVFSRKGEDHLLYEESGTLNYADQPPMAATRRYLWVVTQDGIDVLFEDGRPFHTIEKGRSMPDANHHCDPDLYHVSYDFTRWPQWSSSWRVVGPRKDYRMVSEYRLIGP